MPYETTEFIDFTRRMIRRAGERVADADEWELSELLALQGTLAEAIQTAVDGMRERGMSWAYIASATDSTRSAAFQRWGHKTAPEEISEAVEVVPEPVSS